MSALENLVHSSFAETHYPGAAQQLAQLLIAQVSAIRVIEPFAEASELTRIS